MIALTRAQRYLAVVLSRHGKITIKCGQKKLVIEGLKYQVRDLQKLAELGHAHVSGDAEVYIGKVIRRRGHLVYTATGMGFVEVS